MEFSEEQQLSFNKYVEGKNIFITGPGGTGKSALIKHIQRDAYAKGKYIQVCALTGCAAVLLECKAKTLHSWSGIGLGKGPIEQLIKKVNKNKHSKALWKETDILVVDEVSMMSLKLFETLDAIGKSVRKNSKPFGGLQLIFSGDFYQLPPVGDRDDPDTSKFCFESEFWFLTFRKQEHIQLKKIFRQTDPVYQGILNQVREGRLKRSSNDALLHNVGREIDKTATIRPTKLFPTRNKVDSINASEMCKLAGDEIEYKIKYHGDLDMTPNERLIRLNYSPEQIKTELEYLKGNLRCDENIRLKIGSQVMCIVNIELTNGEMLCNGSQGLVVRFSTMDKKQPVIRFNNGFEMTMNYHVWPSENIPGVGVSQLPLILAWALTIHKAQGATLDVAEIDAGSGIFECGQTYVALSRVKSLEGLYLTSFDARKIRIHKKVQEFYQELANIASTSTSTSSPSLTQQSLLTTIPIAEAELVSNNNIPVATIVNAIPIVEVSASDTHAITQVTQVNVFNVSEINE
jgi:ATP-dependent DNA helicase PIF1